MLQSSPPRSGSFTWSEHDDTKWLRFCSAWGLLKADLDIAPRRFLGAKKTRLRLVWKCLKGRKLLKLPKNCEVVPRCSVLSPCFVPGEVGVWLFGGDDLCATGSTCPCCHCGFSVQDGKAPILMASPGQWLGYAMLLLGFCSFPMVSPRVSTGFPWQIMADHGCQVPSCWHWLLDTLAFRFAAFRASDSAAVGKCLGSFWCNNSPFLV